MHDEELSFIKLSYDNISFLFHNSNFISDRNVDLEKLSNINLQKKLEEVFNIDMTIQEEMKLIYINKDIRLFLKINTIVTIIKYDLSNIKLIPNLLRSNFMNNGIIGIDIYNIKHPTYLLDLESFIKEKI